MSDTQYPLIMDVASPPVHNPDEIKSVLEAVLFAASEPISLEQFGQLFDDVSTWQIRQQLMQLRDEYQEMNRSFQLIEIANGFQICTHAEYHPWIEKFYTDIIEPLGHQAKDRNELYARHAPDPCQTLAFRSGSPRYRRL